MSRRCYASLVVRKGNGGMSRLTGMEEAERQIRVARRLYEATGGKKTWDKSPGQRSGTFLTLEERRPFIDLSCWGDLIKDDGYGL